MPANLTPQYKRAEELFRQASSTEEKLEALELMLGTIPKHKGTDHMQADIKRRIAKLRAVGSVKGGARQIDIFHVPKGTAGGQVAMLGTPNSGKSSLVAHLTSAHVHVADFPFSTTKPTPGIMMHEDVPIQLVDMPPITPEHVEAGQVGTYRHCDLIMVVVDLAAADVTDQMETCLGFLRDRGLLGAKDKGQADDIISRHLVRPCLGVCTKVDLTDPGDFDVMRDMYHSQLEMTSSSVNDQASLDQLSKLIFQKLNIVRVYSKLPGKKPVMAEPFTVFAGATVYDLAFKIHRELADKIKFARIWGQQKYPGQHVPLDYQLHDKDIIELHFA